MWQATTCIYVASSCILWVNISISGQFMHIVGEYLYIQSVHAYCRRISIYLPSSCISRVNMYIYIQTKRTYGLVPPIILCFGDARCWESQPQEAGKGCRSCLTSPTRLLVPNSLKKLWQSLRTPPKQSFSFAGGLEPASTSPINASDFTTGSDCTRGSDLPTGTSAWKVACHYCSWRHWRPQRQVDNLEGSDRDRGCLDAIVLDRWRQGATWRHKFVRKRPKWVRNR